MLKSSNERKPSSCLLVCAMLVSLVSGCSDSVTLEDLPEQPQGPVESIQPLLDVSNRTTEVIGPDGGSVIMNDINGREYTLDFPPGVLPDDIEITMTPVIAALGLPSSSTFHYGVQFEPEGLLMVEPAILTIKAPDGVPATELVGIGWQGDGENLYLKPVNALNSTLRFPITHFSGSGVADGGVDNLKKLIKTGEQRAARFVSELAGYEEEILEDLCGAVIVRVCVLMHSNFPREYLQKMATKALPLLSEWLNELLAQSDGSAGQVSGRQLAEDYYAWLHAAVTTLCGVGELGCKKFDDEYPVLAEDLRISMTAAILEDFVEARNDCDDIQVAELSAFLSFADNPSVWGVADLLREHLGIEPEAQIVSIVQELRQRYACRLEIEVDGFPSVFDPDEPDAQVIVQLRNKADETGASVENVEVFYSLEEGSCGGIDGVFESTKERAQNTIISGRIPGFVVSADDCSEESDKVVLKVRVEDRLLATTNESFFLGSSVTLEAGLVDPCVPDAPTAGNSIEKAGALEECEETYEILFTSDLDGPMRNVYAITPDGSGRRQVTSSGVLDLTPTWAPNFAKIIFARLVDGNTDIDLYVIDADGTDERLLLDTPSGAVIPSLSADGTKMTFVDNDSSGTAQIFIAESDGTNVRQLTSGSVHVSNPDLSPDGGRVLFDCADPNGSGFREICVMDADGSNVEELTADGDITPDRKAKWSPDGTRIVYQREGSDFGIFVMNPDGSGRRRLTSSGLVCNSPVWSPTGAQVACLCRDSSGAYQINILGADGTGQKAITGTGDIKVDIAWSP